MVFFNGPLPMPSVYFDNAATTPLADEVLAEMLPYLQNVFGNPSSIHAHGREARAAIEKARKKIAELLQTSPSEIFFTSGGTEADNFALASAIEVHNIRHVISSPLEHHAVLHTLEYLQQKGKISLHLLPVDALGQLDLDTLQAWLTQFRPVLVSLMHGNNEIGNLIDLEAIGGLCREHGALFHSDTVQTLGHYAHTLQHLPVDYIVGSAHKFHGPKGVGFIYIRAEQGLKPFIHGGAQERNMRGGTENIYGIVGMAKALELAYAEMEKHRRHIEGLKDRFVKGLQAQIPDVQFYGLSADPSQSLYTVVNVSLPPSDKSDLLLFNLDIHKISASAGSACSSGSDIGSHVLRALGASPKRAAVRFSFSRYNTEAEVDFVLHTLRGLYVPAQVIVE
ncbi:MAG: cysteine desulfurase family protein [Microscillaceae bacterium]